MGIPDSLTCLLRNLYAGQEATVITSLKQLMGSKLGMEYIKALYCHPAYLTSMQSTSCEMTARWLTNCNQDCWKKYQQPKTCRWYHSNDRKQRETKEPLGKGERREWKSWFKSQHSKHWDHVIWFHHFMANIWGNSGNSDTFSSLGLQNHCGWLLQLWH